MITVVDGLLALSKRVKVDGEGAEILVAPDAIVAIDPHRNGCFVYAGGHKWDVAHAHTEIAQAIRTGRAGPRAN